MVLFMQSSKKSCPQLTNHRLEPVDGEPWVYRRSVEIERCGEACAALELPETSRLLMETTRCTSPNEDMRRATPANSRAR
jgi:hypothetical protein